MSLAMSRKRKCGVKSRDAARAATRLTIGLPGTPSVRIPIAFSGLSPPALIRANASPNEAVCTAARKLLISFIRDPLPLAPRWTTSRPSTDKTGRARRELVQVLLPEIEVHRIQHAA